MKIIENFIAEQEFKKIQEEILSNKFSWYYVNGVANIEEKKSNEDFYFVHTFFDKTIRSNYFYLIEPILNILQPKALIRIKANLYPSNSLFYKHELHKDLDFLHNGAVYYVNDNNGYTELEDGTKIKSVENRILLFDSSKLHRSTNCTNNDVRLTINFNYF